MSDPAPSLLASMESDPTSVVVEGANLYWADDIPSSGAIRVMPASGGMPRTLAAGQNGPTWLVVDAMNADWSTSDGAIMSVPLAGGSPRQIASGFHPNARIAIGPSFLFIADFNGGTISEVPLTGGAPVVLASGENHPSGLAVLSGGGLVWADAGSLTAASSDGSLQELGGPAGMGQVALAKGLGPTLNIAVDRLFVYWAQRDNYVRRVRLDASLPMETLATGVDCPYAIQVDDSGVYWTEPGCGTSNCFTGAIMKLARCASAPFKLVTQGYGATGLALDSGGVYWTTIGGGDVFSHPR